MQSQLLLAFSYHYIEDYKNAIKAYSKVLNIEPEDGDSWANLASLLVKEGSYKSAYKTQLKAVEFGYERWEYWDNLLTYSMKIKEYKTAIRCLHRLVDMKQVNKE